MTNCQAHSAKRAIPSRKLPASPLVLLLFLSAGGMLPCAGEPAQVLWRESFDGAREASRFRDRLAKHENVTIAPGAGPDGSAALRVIYRSGQRGSEGISFSLRLPESAPCISLSYDVRFEPNFDFARGGKLPGLGPENPVTGGNAMHATGWSARPMWREHGLLTSYVYHQNKPGKYGEYQKAKGFRLPRGRYLPVTVVVKVNGAAGTRDGIVEIFVDGVRRVVHAGLELHRGSGEEELSAAAVNRLVFSTFHGGNDESWAPKDAKGRFRDVVAWFDNVEISAGRTIRSSVRTEPH